MVFLLKYVFCFRCSISQFLSNTVPGFSDVRDVYWKGGEVLKNGYNQWFGFPHVNNTSAGVQPIGKAAKVVRPDVVNVGTNLQRYPSDLILF